MKDKAKLTTLNEIFWHILVFFPVIKLKSGPYADRRWLISPQTSVSLVFPYKLCLAEPPTFFNVIEKKSILKTHKWANNWYHFRESIDSRSG